MLKIKREINLTQKFSLNNNKFWAGQINLEMKFKQQFIYIVSYFVILSAPNN